MWRGPYHLIPLNCPYLLWKILEAECQKETEEHLPALPPGDTQNSQWQRVETKRDRGKPGYILKRPKHGTEIEGLMCIKQTD